MDRLSPQALERVSGPSWGQLKATFLQVSEILLDVGPETHGQLTTIYVKYTTTRDPAADVYAVVWVKTSKQLLVGMALPDGIADEHLGDPPAGTKYKGLTKYFILRPGEPVPERLRDWAEEAYKSVLNRNR